MRLDVARILGSAWTEREPVHKPGRADTTIRADGHPAASSYVDRLTVGAPPAARLARLVGVG
jgi:hypothetical protein